MATFGEELSKLTQEIRSVKSAVWSLVETFGNIADRMDKIETILERMDGEKRKWIYGQDGDRNQVRRHRLSALHALHHRWRSTARAPRRRRGSRHPVLGVRTTVTAARRRHDRRLRAKDGNPGNNGGVTHVSVMSFIQGMKRALYEIENTEFEMDKETTNAVLNAQEAIQTALNAVSLASGHS